MAMSDVHPNPMGREYTPAEWRAAKHMWPQYKKPGEHGRGPLIYATGPGQPDAIVDEIRKTKRRLVALQTLIGAVEREWRKPIRRDEG